MSAAGVGVWVGSGRSGWVGVRVGVGVVRPVGRADGWGWARIGVGVGLGWVSG